MVELTRRTSTPVPRRRLWDDWPTALFDEDIFAPFRTEMEATKSGFVPAVDISENGSELRIVAELPGVKKQDLKVEFKDGVLTLSGERKQEEEEKDDKYHRVERRYGFFQRSFTLPDYVEPEKIQADIRDGCLTVSVPKSEKQKPKQIEVKVK